MPNLSPLRYWVQAARLKTLPASLAPIGVALALASSHHQIQPHLALLTVAAAACIQLGTNTANDVIDANKGADTPARVGPARMVSSGYISAHQMRVATGLLFLMALVFTLLLAAYSSWWLLILGLVAIVCGYGYTAGPYALAYTGMADIAALVFFGPISTCGTYFIQTGTVHWQAVPLGLGIGCLAVALLCVNNCRDRHEDAQANKRTLVVRFGPLFGKLEYTLCLAISCGVLWYGLPHTALTRALSWLYTLVSVALTRHHWGAQGTTYNRLLGHTALLLIGYAALCIVALLL